MDLTDEQKRAVTLMGRILAAACPGSGKTRVIAQRIIWLIGNRIPPANILASTFTRLAAREMRERVSKVTGIAVETMGAFSTRGPNICTVHSLCTRYLRDRGLLRNFFGERGNPGEEQLLRELGIYDDIKTFTRVSALVKSRCADENVPKSVFEECLSGDPGKMTLAKFANAYNRFEYEKAKRGLQNHDDTLILALREMRAHPESVDLWTHVMRDESQDENPVQCEIMDLISSTAKSVLVVGDPNQAIYGFRGSKSHLMMEKSQTSQIVRLITDFRSLSEIVRAANIINQMQEFEHPEPMKYVNTGGVVDLVEFTDEIAEAEFIAGRIAASGEGDRNAVLFRTGRQSWFVENALTNLEIPFAVYGTEPIFKTREFHTLRSYLALWSGKGELSDVPRFLFNPKRYLKGWVWSSLKATLEDGPLDFARVASALHSINVRRERNVAQTAIEAQRLADTRIVFSLARFAAHACRDILAPAERAKDAETPEDSRSEVYETLAMALQDCETLDDVDALVSQSNERINVEVRPDIPNHLMTVHKSKGMEFDRVFIAGCVDGLMPHAMADDMNEELNIFFVALTRAIRECVICIPRSYDGKPRNPSPYAEALHGMGGRASEVI